MRIWQSTSAVLSVILIVIGATVVVRTIMAGGSGLALGYFIGGGLVIAGLLRLWLARALG